MTIQLAKNSLVCFSATSTRRENARVRGWIDKGCICLAFSGTIALRPGTQVQLETPDSYPRAFFYTQAVEIPDKQRTELYLSRNVTSQFDRRRRYWRVPFSGKTAIRQKNGEQFSVAIFTNISMEAGFLLSTKKLDVGTDVEIKLQLPEYPEHLVAARIMRSSEIALDADGAGRQRFGMLAKFTEMSEAATRHLTYFMWQQIRKTNMQRLKTVYADVSVKRSLKPEEADKLPMNSHVRK